MDLACAQIDPLERVARVVHFDPLAWRELARGHRRLSVLRKLAIKLLPEVRVGRERLRALFPNELQRVTQPQLVHDLRPIKLRHPQRVGTGLGLIGRAAHPIAHFPHRDTRAPQRSRNLPNATAFLQPSLNFFISIHRELPPRHCDPSPRSRKTANGTGPNRSSKRLAQVGPIRGNRVGPISGNQVVPILGNRVGPIRGNFAVNVSDWGRILKEAGFADLLLVGVHLPAKHESYARPVVELVRRAHEQLVLGHYPAAVADCRLAIESLWKSANLTASARDARKRLVNVDGQLSMSKRDRELALGE